ncbi:UTRA domain-containing protein [Streptomyces scabiei]|uniref:UTRA domain-containing protein n=1 Tax=Streptomyces scabiei TaxID=1930 RepID=UPI0029902CE8|nr:UTRA domain-containing protein [Streptomyces scabiei]MDW8806776.1 UTRA domain-containing protein [Streptomyces scabiei]
MPESPLGIRRAGGTDQLHPAALEGDAFDLPTPVARPAGARRAGSARVSGGAPYRRSGVPDRTVPPLHVAAALALEAGEKALRRIRLVLLDDGTPHTLVTAWFPPSIADAAPRLAQKGPIAEGTTHYVRRETGRSPVEGTDVTTVRPADDEEARLLEMEGPATVAVVLHVAYDRDHRPLVCEEGVTPSHVFKQSDSYPMQ